ncbi:VWA domain-containing protein [Indioceanicola profundi]|uniref:VWA domain-containing protein n=1 Tax=Indioceanicola profundi TaxID=2220096 RepID=UPI000E6AA511|nr:VWA domain-containing protein [Indioceanicola profundi]
MIMRRCRLPAASMLALILTAAGSIAAAEGFGDDPYAGDPAGYPQPVPVETVGRKADPVRHPSLAAAPLYAPALAADASRSVRIELLSVARGAEIAGTPVPEGMEAVVLVTRWTNLTPRQSVEKSQLEGKADRSMGAGALLGGGGKGKAERVEVDVAYKVPAPSRHAFLAADGLAYEMAEAGAGLPNALPLSEDFILARHGESREARMAFLVPKGAKDLALRYFDNIAGHVTLAVAGSGETALAPPKGIGQIGRLGPLEVAVRGITWRDRHGDTAAPKGWRIAVVDLVGRGKGGAEDAQAFARLDPTRFTWLAGDKGQVAFGLPQLNGVSALSFAPEIFQRRELAFLVPAAAERFRLGIQGPDGAVSLPATPGAPAPLPDAAVRHADGSVLALHVFGRRWEGEHLVVDIGVLPKDPARGVDFSLDQQFRLIAGGKELAPDMAMTGRLTRRPPSPATAPPTTALRFELAYAVPKDAAADRLAYKGFAGDKQLDLSALSVAGSRGTATPEGTTDFPVFAEPAAPPTPVASPAAAPASPAERRPVELPRYDFAKAGQEQEPNNKFEMAGPLGPDLTVKGTLTPNDTDLFFFDVEGEPQLWVFEAEGEGVGELAYLDASGWAAEQRPRDNATGPIWLDNLYLAPGRHWISLRSYSKGSDYTLRAVPLGAPTAADEQEPNGRPNRAHPLTLAGMQRGLIAHPRDVDHYSFALEVPSYVRLTLDSPPDLKLDMRLEGGRIALYGGGPSAPDGKPVVYEALLGPGDFAVQVSSGGRGASRTHYHLSLELLDPFELPADLEPNDMAAAARPIDGRQIVNGQLGTFQDEDWFLLPEVGAETELTVTVEAETAPYVTLRQADGRNAKSERLAPDPKRKSDAAQILTATLQPGARYMLGLNGRTSYRLTTAFSPELPASAAVPKGEAPVIAMAGEVPTFAAWRAEAQTAELPVTLSNPGKQPQTVELQASTGRAGWQVTPPSGPITLAPGESRNVPVRVTADADLSDLGPTALFLRARAAGGAGRTLRAEIPAACAAPPQSPHPFRRVPDALRGGLNLASLALGAVPAGESAVAQLFDGVAPLGGEWSVASGGMPADITVQLAGDGTLPLAGIAILPQSQDGDQDQLGPFTVLVSDDGQQFREIHRGVLTPAEQEQFFVFDRPVAARHLRLRLEPNSPLSTYGRAALAEVKAIAVPDARLPGATGPNLANPALGGHIVRAVPRAYNYDILEGMLAGSGERPALHQTREDRGPVEWVVGFQDNRAARITELRWREQAQAPASHEKQFRTVEVAASLEGPLGPWVELGDWTLGLEPDGTSALPFETPQWARFLRFRQATPSGETASWLLPEKLEVIEQAAGGDYRSILGEWGLYARDAIREELAAGANMAILPAAGPDAGAAAAEALVLAAGTTHADQVSVGEDEDWYAVDVPKDANRLEFLLGGAGSSRVAAVLLGPDGAEIALTEVRRPDGSREVYADVAGGARYLLRVAEPPRSIMVAWDNSSSVGPYHPTMYRALQGFFDALQPGREWANLLPFQERGAKPLLDSWSDDDLTLKRALAAYNRRDSSSNAENTLVGALAALEQQPGNHAVVVLTDAISNGFDSSQELWNRLEALRPAIFPLELHLRDSSVTHAQDLMQDWAAVNRGHYASFRSSGDLDGAFARAACLMRRPVEYSVAAATRYVEPPKPGELAVRWEKGQEMAGAAVELVFDASGSMRSKKHLVDGKLRIDVAKQVMREVVSGLPEDVNVGLRVYGHRIKEGQKGDCQDTELMVPVGKLDRKAMLNRIEGVKALGTTPIAYALRQAGADLAKTDGRKMILLVTDGEEECKGDPAAVIKELRAGGMDLQVNVAGFTLIGDAVKNSMRAAAAAGGGTFFDAQDRQGLLEAIGTALAVPYDLVDAGGVVTASGVVGSGSVSAPPGTYNLVVHTAKGAVTVGQIELRDGETGQIELSGKDGQLTYRAGS